MRRQKTPRQQRIERVAQEIIWEVMNYPDFFPTPEDRQREAEYLNRCGLLGGEPLCTDELAEAYALASLSAKLGRQTAA